MQIPALTHAKGDEGRKTFLDAPQRGVPFDALEPTHYAGTAARDERCWRELARKRGGLASFFETQLFEILQSLEFELGWSDLDRLRFVEGYAARASWPAEVLDSFDVESVREIREKIAAQNKGPA